MTPEFKENLIALLPRLRRFARSLTGSADKADDLVQSASAKAIAAHASWASGTRFDSWMFRITRNAWIDGLRQQRRESIVDKDADYDHIAGSDGEAATIARLTLKAALAAVDDLPPDQREVLTLVVMEEFSYAEAADVLGIPVGTVMSRLARAREKIAAATGIERKGQR
jgi:RNA polymerase sigma-70 factor, ECF subfamily